MDKIKLGLHDGTFHADDVFCAALILGCYDDNVEIIRTRDETLLSTCDIIADVGGGIYDHHQKDKKLREDGVPYAAISLLWQDFGQLYIKKVFNVNMQTNLDFLSEIDYLDNGVSIGNTITSTTNICDIIDLFNSDWEEEVNDIYFNEAVKFAKKILKKKVKQLVDNVLLTNMIKSYMQQQKNERYLVLDKYFPWQTVLLENEFNKGQYLYVVFPSSKGEWIVQGVPVEMGSFECRKFLPKSWGSLRSNLSEVSGVEGCVFCHSNLFMAINETKDGAITLAKIAIDNKKDLM